MQHNSKAGFARHFKEIMMRGIKRTTSWFKWPVSQKKDTIRVPKSFNYFFEKYTPPQKRNIYAFDCGTTHWHIQSLRCLEMKRKDGTGQLYALSKQEERLPGIFEKGHLLAALLLDQKQVQSYGKESYQKADQHKKWLDLHEGFKLSIGNPDSHQDGLHYTHLLLKEVLKRLEEEKYCCFDDDSIFIFTYPIDWERYKIVEDFRKKVRQSFPQSVPKNLRFVSEADAMLESLSRLEDLKKSPEKLTLVVDIGGGTTQFVAAQWTGQKFEKQAHYEAALGGRQFDHELAKYVAKNILKVPQKKQQPYWALLLYQVRKLKEDLSQNHSTKENIFFEWDDGGFEEAEVQLNKDTFEKETKQTRVDFENLVWQALHKMGVPKSKVGQVVLVGGGANLFLVRQIWPKIFGQTQIYSQQKPEETIVRGAALWALSQSW